MVVIINNLLNNERGLNLSMIKKASLIIILFSLTIAQVSMSDVRKLSEDQIDAIREELKSAPVSVPQTGLDKPEIIQKVEKKTKDENFKSAFFGYEFFNTNINFFDNIPTPSNYKLGPGDEIKLSLWGETNVQENFFLNKDGSIYYQNIGFINLSNKNIQEAEQHLVEQLSQIYSTLNNKDNPTNLSLELQRLKSLNIYFTGQVNSPGVHLVHPFSDVFSALVQAGGVQNIGTLRNIKVIRNSKEIDSIDFYDFFLYGNDNFKNLKLVDGDTIHVPIIEKRVSISGEVLNPFTFELKDDENFKNLLEYSGGYSSNAGQSIIFDKILPQEKRDSDDEARKIKTLKFSDNLNNEVLNNGDKIFVSSLKISDKEVFIQGRVKRPGSFLVENGSSLKEVLHLAGGFQDEIYIKSINTESILVIRRLDGDLASETFNISYENSDKFFLEIGDVIQVYKKNEYLLKRFVDIEGAVRFPGRYPFVEKMTISDLVLAAGGLTENAYPEKGILYSTSIMNESDNDFNIDIERINVFSASLDTEISNFSKVSILEKTSLLLIEGNVFNPGAIAYDNITASQLIQKAGGFKKRSDKKRIYKKSLNGEIQTLNFAERTFKNLEDGDMVFVPLREDEELDITTFLSDFSSTLANIVTILLVIENIQED